ncbi:DnaA regulatory inactivator Hda [Thiobacter aerophilum]|uniref:DnaA regulatory inactivator Hda n=1 Tax=Thiobacter aerophilum TaxID=3121275 RepID=A0ABV0EI22_9BURK
MKQLVLKLAPPPPPTLENFVVGANAETLAGVRALLQGRAGERFLYLWGGRGCGKSHLATGFVHGARALGLSTAWLTPGRDALDVPALAAHDAVVVEDVERFDDAAQVALFDLVNRLREGTGLMLVTGCMPPRQLSLRPELATRLGQGLVYQVHGLSDADKEQALMAHARARGFILAPEVAAYLLRSWRRDLPSLMALLDALDRHSLVVKRPITLPLVREVLGALTNGKKP